MVLVSSPGVELDKATQDYEVKGFSVSMERRISLFKDVKSLFNLIRLFKKERPDVVHSMTPKAGLLCMMAAWMVRTPIRIHTFTGLVFPTSKGLKKRILMLTDRLTCSCATHIIPEGEGVKNDLLNHHITKKDMHVLGYGNVMGVDMEKFSLREEVKTIVQAIIKKDVFTFLFVGRIVRDKGINELILAMNQMLAKYHDVRLILVGDFEDSLNPISEETRKLIQKYAEIETVGVKRGDELIAYYAAADCFVFPSYREGFPNTVLEAGAMGLPSIVTNINGSREIIEEGKNGLIVPARDVNSLYDAMETMFLEKDGKTKEMASHARKMIADRFEQGFVRLCLYDFYKEIGS